MEVTVNGVLTDRALNDEELAVISIGVSAFDGEVGTGSFPVPDYGTDDDNYGGQSIAVTEGAVYLTNGTIDDQQRERHGNERITTRLNTFTVRDANAFLYGFRTAGWKRPAESDRARWLAFAAKYLPTFDVTNVLNTGLVTLPAKTYDSDGGASELIADTIDLAGKTVFVEEGLDGTRYLHVHTLGEGDAAGISITDDPGTPDGVTVFYPGNPVRIRTPADLANNIRGRGPGGTSLQANAASMAIHNTAGLRHERLIDFADATTQALVDAYTTQYLQESKSERLTYEVTIEPLDATALALFRAGQIVNITSQALGLSADDQRISYITYTVYRGRDGKPAPGLWSARLELGRPNRTAGPRRRPSPPPIPTKPGPPGTTTDPFRDCPPFEPWDIVGSATLPDYACGFEFGTFTYTDDGATDLQVDPVGSELTITYSNPGGSPGFLGAAEETGSSTLVGTMDAPLLITGTVSLPATGVAGTATSDLGMGVAGGFGGTAWEHHLGISLQEVLFGDGAGFSAKLQGGFNNIGSGGAAQPSTLSISASGSAGLVTASVETGLTGADSPTLFFKVYIADGRLKAKGWTTSEPGAWMIDTPCNLTYSTLCFVETGGIPFDATNFAANVYTASSFGASANFAGTCGLGDVDTTGTFPPDWTVTGPDNLAELSTSAGTVTVRWQDSLDDATERSLNLAVSRTATVSAAFLQPALSSPPSGQVEFRLPFSIAGNLPRENSPDDPTAWASVRMKVTLPDNTARGVGGYVAVGDSVVEVYEGGSWSGTGGHSRPFEYAEDTIYTLVLTLDTSTVRAGVVGGPEAGLPAMSTWTPGTPPTGDIEVELSVVGSVVFSSTVTLYPLDIKGSNGAVSIPGFWCSAPELSEVADNIVGYGDGSRIRFTTPSSYAPGSLVVKVDGITQTVREVDPGAGTFELYFAPVAGEVITATYAHSSTSPIIETGPWPPPAPGGYDATVDNVADLLTAMANLSIGSIYMDDASPWDLSGGCDVNVIRSASNPIVVVGGANLIWDANGRSAPVLYFQEAAYIDMRNAHIAFRDSNTGETGLIDFGGYPDQSAPHHIQLGHIDIDSSCLGATDHNSQGIYIAGSRDQVHDIDIGYVTANGSGGLYSCFHWYHEPTGRDVVFHDFTITNFDIGILQYAQAGGPGIVYRNGTISGCTLAVERTTDAGTTFDNVHSANPYSGSTVNRYMLNGSSFG